MPVRVFISYRRDDSAGHAGRIHDRLEREFGRDLLFMDVDAIPLGADFKQVLAQAVAKCDALLVVIGPSWIDAQDEAGGFRLFNTNDFVHIEIVSALARGIPVIPLLIEGTVMPAPDELPLPLRELSHRNGLHVRHSSFHTDMDKLVRALLEQARTRTLTVEVGTRERRATRQLAPGGGRDEWFQDMPGGPELVVVAAGRFLMGSPADEPERDDCEGPQRFVEMARPFAVSRHGITRSQYAAFVAATGRPAEGARIWVGNQWVHDSKGSWANPGFVQHGDHPAVCVSWDDAKAYVEWLSNVTERTYRLPSEAEWEYVARAGTTTPFWWGTMISPAQANYHGTTAYGGGGSVGEYRDRTVAADRFDANPWGLYQVHGNVWEWCEDVWHADYVGAPPTPVPWTIGGDANKRVIRGGSWEDFPECVRSAYRFGVRHDLRTSLIGLRVVRVL